MNSPETEPNDGDPLVKEVRRRKKRHDLWVLKRDASVARHLAQIGVLGWMIVVPMLLGMFAGRWLDRFFGTGIFWTAPLLMIGLILGCWSAWKWVESA